MVGTEAKIQTSFRYGHVAYRINRNDACSNMIANILPSLPYSPHTHKPEAWDQKVKFHLFSEYGHVAYQIKGT